MRVTNRADKELADVVPGVRRAIYFDAAEGSAQLTFGAAEIDPGKEIPVHRHKVGADERRVSSFSKGEGEVRVGDQASPIVRIVLRDVAGRRVSQHPQHGNEDDKFVMCSRAPAFR